MNFYPNYSSVYLYIDLQRHIIQSLSLSSTFVHQNILHFQKKNFLHKNFPMFTTFFKTMHIYVQ